MNARSLMAILACAVAVPAVAGPRWAAGAVKEVRVLGDDLEVVRILSDRAELDAFAAWFHRAREVEAAPPGRAWTHKLDIDAPRGGRWLYDAGTGEFTVLAMKRAPVYRLEPEDRARFAALLTGGAPPSAVDASRVP